MFRRKFVVPEIRELIKKWSAEDRLERVQDFFCDHTRRAVFLDYARLPLPEGGSKRMMVLICEDCNRHILGIIPNSH